MSFEVRRKNRDCTDPVQLRQDQSRIRQTREAISSSLHDAVLPPRDTIQQRVARTRLLP